MKKAKEFKNYQEQISILNSKGLITNDNSINILRRNNYYFLINRYKDLFVIPNSKPNKFINGTHFSELVAVYEFDRDLRSMLLKYIMSIENTMKSLISYWFAYSYGHNYTKRDFFDTLNNNPKRIRSINSLVGTIISTIKKSTKDHKYIKYYNDNYEQIPIWVIINDLSLSSVSKFYSFMHNKDQKNIAAEFNIDVDTLDTYIRILTFYRNLAAHNQRVFDEKCSFLIPDGQYHETLNIKKIDNEYQHGKNDILALIIIFKELLEKKDYQRMCLELDEIISTLDDGVNIIEVSQILDKMGFPENWKLLYNL